MGYRGAGVVVAGQDTGYDWENPRIQPSYRGWDGTRANHNYHWHDAIREINLLHNDTIIAPENNPCGLDVDAPCDDHNHGTHTMGTMVGQEEEGDQIGVAPEAQWIGCRNMERGWGSPASYLECFDWFLAPTDLNGANPDPSLAPHVINNSWSCPAVEGCDSMNVVLLQQATEALRAAGIFVVASAGNDGPSCNTISKPAAMFEAAFTVGAIGSNDTIGRFSSRGVVTSDGSFRLKPNIVAPGVGVRSIVRNGQYRTWNGTSMASPHVAGAVALLISANPQLAGEVDSIQHILETTAIPRTGPEDCEGSLGSEVPNAVYGYGSLNVLAAVERALEVEIVDTEEVTAAQLTLYPNPIQDQLNVRWNFSSDQIQLSIRDTYGRLVSSQQLRHNPAQLDLSHLPAGVYFYEWISMGTQGSGKLVVE
ncbi:MAG: T9SS C-terminal target domain-containing protein [Bacteroidetes bacterium]|nr:MAG: T9SS C-terminal target domain-containing protein [Bacteroidota bacterium]